MIAHRVLLAAGILAAVMLGSLSAIAADWKPFTQAEFSAAQKEGRVSPPSSERLAIATASHF